MTLQGLKLVQAFSSKFAHFITNVCECHDYEKTAVPRNFRLSKLFLKGKIKKSSYVTFFQINHIFQIEQNIFKKLEKVSAIGGSLR